MLNTNMTLAEAFQQVASSRLDQGALVCGEERFTYGQLLERVDGVVLCLSEIDIGKGDKVICLLPPGPEFISLFFAVARLGGVFIPLNPRIRPRGTFLHMELYIINFTLLYPVMMYAIPAQGSAGTGQTFLQGNFETRTTRPQRV